MVSQKTHKDVAYQVHGLLKTYRLWNEAMGCACGIAQSTGETVLVDCLVWSEKGAKWLMGNEGVARYRKDPDASIFERFKINVNNIGRVP